MRVLLASWGSEGDVRPIAALAVALARRGHDVRLAADANFAPLVEGHGITLLPLAGEISDVQALASNRHAKALYTKGTDPRVLTQALVGLARDHMVEWTRMLHEAARDADLLVAAGLPFYVLTAIAEKLDLPLVGIALQPLGPTKAFPPALLPPPKRPWPGWLLPWVHIGLMQLIWQAFRPAVNRARREVLGLPASLFGPSRLVLDRKWPILYGYSPALLPKPDDWPEQLTVTGFWYLDPPAGWTPPPEVEAFLAAGEPPVYVGFGSMAGHDPQAATRMVLDALDGRRAIFAQGWGGLATDDLPPTVIGVQHLPHSWLFPKVAAIVHHCGAGTTGAALRAGKPTVPVPFLGDQPFWAWRLGQLGVATPPIPRAEMTAERLRTSLDQALSEPIRSRAAALGEQVSREDGLAAACAVIEAAAG